MKWIYPREEDGRTARQYINNIKYVALPGETPRCLSGISGGMVLFSVKQVLLVRCSKSSYKVKGSREGWNGFSLLSFM